MKFYINIDEHSLHFNTKQVDDNIIISLDDTILDVDCVQLSQHSYSLILKGQTHYLTIENNLNSFEVNVDQYTNFVQVKDETALLTEKIGFPELLDKNDSQIHAQIPGLVNKIFVNIGDKVEIGQKLFILEAMKMENEIDATVNGIVKIIHASIGNSVDKGDLIMELDI